MAEGSDGSNKAITHQPREHAPLSGGGAPAFRSTDTTHSLDGFTGVRIHVTPNAITRGRHKLKLTATQSPTRFAGGGGKLNQPPGRLAPHPYGLDGCETFYTTIRTIEGNIR